MDTLEKRRKERGEYVIDENGNTWSDPEGYVKEVVWMNYRRDHAFLFEHGNVEGKVKKEVCHELGIDVVPEDFGNDMEKILGWSVDIIERHIANDSRC